MDRIAYHPIRVSPHASLFLPYSEQELQVYKHESLNTLRRSSAFNSTLNASNQMHSSAKTNNDNEVGMPNHSNLESNSPLDYATPSPFSITLDSSSYRAHDVKDPSHQTPSLSTHKRARQASDSPNDNHTALGPSQLNSVEPELNGYANQRALCNLPSRQLPPSSPEVSISDAVAQHYNARPNLTKGARTDSPIFGLRKLNNWIKSVIIGKFASFESQIMAPLMRYQNHNQMYYQGKIIIGTKVLELGCGKGGDLAKWQNAGVRELYGFDIASVSIEQAQSRYLQGCKKRFYAKFAALDCFTDPITSVLSPEELREPFHAVSLQFCMHYAFETEAKVRTMMENVSSFLIPGGVMIGTIPDPDLLIRNWEICSQDSEQDQPSFGNSIYQVTFPYRLTSDSNQLNQVYGNRYQFYLQDAVENVPEYLVLWEPFVEMAREHGLRLIYKQGFHDIVQTEKFDPNFKKLLSKMNLIDSDCNLSIFGDHWEACGIYLAFAFIKE